MDAKINHLQELLSKQEELHEELKPYLQEAQGLGPCLRSPLVYGIPYSEQLNAMYNEQYIAKCQYRDKAFQEGDWGSYIFIHEKPYRVEVLYELERDHSDKISDKDFWKNLGEIWTNIENMWQMEDHLRMLLEMAEYHGRDDQDCMMDEVELKLLNDLPEKFVVYRGHQGINDLGLSWTLSPWRAQWFANRWKTDPEVSRAVIRKEHIVGIFLGRSEMEVGVLPEYLESREDLETTPRSPFIRQMRGIAERQFNLNGNSYHGPWHWDNVERNAAALCRKTPGADTLVCQLFANLHDFCRLNEDEDPQHGPRAAGFIKKLYKSGKLDINPTQFEQLFHAICHHTDGVLHDDPTIGVCWDSDRMDLPRVNIIPDSAYFSTQAAKELIWRI